MDDVDQIVLSLRAVPPAAAAAGVAAAAWFPTLQTDAVGGGVEVPSVLSPSGKQRLDEILQNASTNDEGGELQIKLATAAADAIDM